MHQGDLLEGLSTAQAARLLGIAQGTLHNMRSKGEGPKFFKIGRSVRYRRGDVLRYIDQRTTDPER